MAIGGNGVDLFFVISGFCMYYFYAAKRNFSYHDFYRFLVKRWVRLSPAFYASTIVYTVVEKYIYHYKVNSINNFLHSVFYLNYIGEQYYTASHFWTLSVEWQFYFIIPLLLIYQNKFGFKNTFSIIFGTIIIIALICIFSLISQVDPLTNTILFRSVEFGCGILAARALIKNIFLKYRVIWLISFVFLIYAGRILISKQVLALSYYYNMFKLLGFTLMGGGFAGVLYLSITSVKWLNLILGNRLFKTMGRISYSFYLFHALIFPIIASYLMQFMPLSKGIIAPVITTCISTIVLYPIAKLSYYLLEKPFLSIGNLTTK
ncbi:MAG TPA: acyltransferase [Mucilaginibacter sp.]